LFNVKVENKMWVRSIWIEVKIDALSRWVDGFIEEKSLQKMLILMGYFLSEL